MIQIIFFLILNYVFNINPQILQNEYSYSNIDNNILQVIFIL